MKYRISWIVKELSVGVRGSVLLSSKKGGKKWICYREKASKFILRLRLKLFCAHIHNG
jgi:hypothetical protein